MLLVGAEGVNARSCQQEFLTFGRFRYKKGEVLLGNQVSFRIQLAETFYITQETNFGPRAAGINHLDADLADRKQQGSVTRDGVKSCVNVYPGRLLASWSLTGGFADCLLELVLPLAPVGQRSLALPWCGGFGIAGVINKKDLKIPPKTCLPLCAGSARLVSLGTVVTFPPPLFSFFFKIRVGNVFSKNQSYSCHSVAVVGAAPGSW